MSNAYLAAVDARIIGIIRKSVIPVSRFVLFLLFAWFGTLKVFGLSPDSELLIAYHSQVFTSLAYNEFMMLLGVYEVVMGLTFIIRGFERSAFFLLLPYLLFTFLPLIMLPDYVWEKWFTPTLEGQYIVKNLALLATALSITAHLRPARKPKVKDEEEKGKK